MGKGVGVSFKAGDQGYHVWNNPETDGSHSHFFSRPSYGRRRPLLTNKHELGAPRCDTKTPLSFRNIHQTSYTLFLLFRTRPGGIFTTPEEKVADGAGRKAAARIRNTPGHSPVTQVKERLRLGFITSAYFLHNNEQQNTSHFSTYHLTCFENRSHHNLQKDQIVTPEASLTFSPFDPAWSLPWCLLKMWMMPMFQERLQNAHLDIGKRSSIISLHFKIKF